MHTTTSDKHPVQDFDRSEPRSGWIAIVGGLTVVFLVATVLGVQFYFDHVKEQQVFIKVLEPHSEALRDLRAREDAQLHTYQYVDREKGVVRLPIDRAMELLVKESAEGRLFYPTRPAPVKQEEPLKAD